jgi:hypothetical protein
LTRFYLHQTALGDNSFLNDLDGLGEDSDEEEEEEEEEEEGRGVQARKDGKPGGNGGVRVKAEDLESLDDIEEEEEEGGDGKATKRRQEKQGQDAMEMEGAVPKALSKGTGQSLDAVATLSKTKRYRAHLERVTTGLALEEAPSMSLPLENDPEYQLILSSNRLVQGR